MKHRLAPLLEGMEMGKSEHDWLEQRLESMTAKEELLFRGAMQIESPRDIQTTIQILQGLDHYQLLYGAEDDVLSSYFSVMLYGLQFAHSCPWLLHLPLNSFPSRWHFSRICS